MRVKRVSRYYCDFCKKAGCSSFYMKKHETHCTNNPNRECGMCDAAGQETESMIDLLAILPNPEGFKKYYKEDAFEWQTFEGLGEAVDKVLPQLREKTGYCPACVLAALRQKGIPVPCVNGFDFKKECASFWKELNDEKNPQYY